jgi:hypothetical protein
MVSLRKWNWIDLLYLSLFTGAALGWGWLYRHFAQDDAFITYRYAQNIVMGHGFVYNPGEPPILGTTTPLYTLLLALGGKLSGLDIRWVSHLISLLSLWVGGMALYALGRDYQQWLAGAAALVFVTQPFFLSAVGMETFWLTALLLLAIWSYVAGRVWTTGFLLGLLALTRYETLLLAGILGGHFFISRRRLPWWLSLTALLFSAWLIFAAYTFGNVIPNSAQAKLTENEGYSFAAGVIIWWLMYIRISFWHTLLLPLVLLGSYAILRYRKLPLAYWLILSWSLVYFGAASLVAGTFPWYYGPLIPGLAIILVWGLAFLAERLSEGFIKVQTKWARPKALERPVFIFLVGALLWLQCYSAMVGWVTYKGQIVDNRHEIYRDVAAWLDQREARGKTLATEEIGVLGYYTQMQIIDLRGLVTPALIPSLQQGRVRMLDRALELYAPDYLLTNQAVLIEAMQRFPDYKLVQNFEGNSYYLYERQSIQGSVAN